MKFIILLAVQLDFCSWMLESNIMDTGIECPISTPVDFKEKSKQFGVEMSVVNVNALFNEQDCSYILAELPKGGSVSNALFIFNVTLDLKNKKCDRIYVSPFSQVQGYFRNVSIIGNISLINV